MKKAGLALRASPGLFTIGDATHPMEISVSSKLTDEQHELHLARLTINNFSALFIDLMVEHVRTLGGDPEESLRRTRKLLDDSLEKAVVVDSATKGSATDAQKSAAFGPTRRMLDWIESNVRIHLGLKEAPGQKH
jgi:hypothetical protein